MPQHLDHGTCIDQTISRIERWLDGIVTIGWFSGAVKPRFTTKPIQRPEPSMPIHDTRYTQTMRCVPATFVVWKHVQHTKAAKAVAQRYGGEDIGRCFRINTELARY